MNWTKEHPKVAEYFWAIPKDRDSWLDGSPEIVKVYFNGKWMVIRPGIGKAVGFEDFSYWSEFSIDYPDGTESLLKELYPKDFA